MPITYTVFQKKGYFESKYTGRIDDATLLESYKNFLQSDEWFPELNELADLGDADLSPLSSEGIIRLQRFSENHLAKHTVSLSKTAIYAPNALAYGLANIYSAFALDSSENTAQFKDKSKAEEWLCK